MKLTAEMSLYPLQDEFKPIIQSYIERMREAEDLEVVSNAMATQVCGDYDRVFAVVSEAFAASTREFGKQVLVVKFIPWELELSA